MIAERLARQSNCFRDSLRTYVATPLLDDSLPGNAGGHLLQDVGHKNSGSSKRRLAMADCRIGDDKQSNHSRCLAIILAVGHRARLKHDYSLNRRTPLNASSRGVHFTDSDPPDDLELPVDSQAARVHVEFMTAGPQVEDPLETARAIGFDPSPD